MLGDEDFMAQVIETEPLSILPPLDAIIDCVCDEYETSVAELAQPSRARRLSEARGVIGWLATRTGAATLTEVSKRFHRDVGTMSHVLRRVDLRSRCEPALATTLEGFRKEIGNVELRIRSERCGSDS